MQDDSKDDLKAGEDDELEDLQDAIRASLTEPFEQVTVYHRSLSRTDFGMMGENVALDEATTQVEHLHEHVSLAIAHEGALNAGVDSDTGTSQHEPLYLGDDEPHVFLGRYSAFVGSTVCFLSWSPVPSTVD
jgi:hypothetical protein